MKYEYERCSLETLEGIERAEKLKETGWTICESSLFSVTMEKENKVFKSNKGMTRSMQDKFDEIADNKIKYDQTHSEVMKTNKYDLFSFIEGNRPVRVRHLNNIRDSIAIKQLPVPIVVDDN